MLETAYLMSEISCFHHDATSANAELSSMEIQIIFYQICTCKLFYFCFSENHKRSFSSYDTIDSEVKK